MGRIEQALTQKHKPELESDLKRKPGSTKFES